MFSSVASTSSRSLPFRVNRDGFRSRLPRSPWCCRAQEEAGPDRRPPRPVLCAEARPRGGASGNPVNQRAASRPCVPMSMMDQPPEVSVATATPAVSWVLGLPTGTNKRHLADSVAHVLAQVTQPGETEPGTRPRGVDPPHPRDAPASPRRLRSSPEVFPPGHVCHWSGAAMCGSCSIGDATQTASTSGSPKSSSTSHARRECGRVLRRRSGGADEDLPCLRAGAKIVSANPPAPINPHRTLAGSP